MNLFRSAACIALVCVLSNCATSPTGRQQFLLPVVSDSQMNALGEQSFAEMKAQIPIDKDPATNAYIKCISDAIVAAGSDLTRDLGITSWEVVVFKDKSANAFALPGGKIGVHTGILPVAQNASQLAAVLGHEVGHVAAKHSAERMSQQIGITGGLLIAGAAISDNPNKGLIMGALGLGTTVGVLMPFGRTQESESDLIGLRLMARAGFDPRESVKLWENMIKASGGGPPEFLSTHPSSENRISDLQKHIPEVMPDYEAAVKAGRAPNCKRPG